MTVQRYRLRYAGAGPIALDPSLTLRPRGGVPMRAERVGRGATRPRRLAG
jgi:hypothetical protein